ncbi:peptidase S41-like protein [Mucilaginibacter oryzae]|uniref:Peptidase S41-like protein n=1 Tax=Mucilaginibacter oryzae TaxID=468058 RepID=A0A316GYP4_9SPHI|nr:S41 family peptidase [Mucilaginibacter oryzae]PWK69968.1 peptidase S41-like protein [Mucilaginibacter oryzae]
MPQLRAMLSKSFVILVLFFAFNPSYAQVKFRGDMETIDPARPFPAGWTYLADVADIYNFKLDSVIKQEGKYSVSISNKGKDIDIGATGFNIPATFKGKEIELRGYLKTENVDGWAGFWLQVTGTEAGDDMSNQKIKGTTNFTEYSIKLPYNDKIATKIVGGARLIGKGKIWVDNVRLYIDGKPINEAAPKQIVLAKAERDTVFNKGSGINDIKLTPRKLLNLTMLAQVWGFIKYHHSAVSVGNVNMDAELFRVMPGVLKANDDTTLSKVLEQWLDRIGTFNPCPTCKPYRGNTESILPDYGNLFDRSVLSPSLTAKLSNVLNYHDVENFYISFPNGPVFQHEQDYALMKYPDAGFRLLCLFRYWNMIRYFYPYRHLTGNWNKVLPQFIPQFINDNNAQQYVLTTLALISSIHDTHADLWTTPELEAYRGKYLTPFTAKFIQGKLVITGYIADSDIVRKSFKIGDVITSINGQPVAALIKKYLPITSASNYQTQLRDMPLKYLLRSNNPNFKIGIQKPGVDKQGSIRAIISGHANFEKLADSNYQKPAYKLINNNIGYLYPGRYHNRDLPVIKQLFNGTKGIIIDMRCYPSETVPYWFIPVSKAGIRPFVKFRTMGLLSPGLMEISAPLSILVEDNYKGKVVVIVNEATQSAAEYTTMEFQSSPDVKVIGSITAGADGGVASILLPGGLHTGISALGVLYPDGTESQRKGVKIDEHIEPTINGIRAGRDELLERATAIINGK